MVLRESPTRSMAPKQAILLLLDSWLIVVRRVGKWAGRGIVCVATPQRKQIVVLVNVQRDRVECRLGADGLLVVEAEGVQLLPVCAQYKDDTNGSSFGLCLSRNYRSLTL